MSDGNIKQRFFKRILRNRRMGIGYRLRWKSTCQSVSYGEVIGELSKNEEVINNLEICELDLNSFKYGEWKDLKDVI